MTLESLTSPVALLLLAVVTALVEVIKRTLPPRISRASWLRRTLPLLAGMVGAVVASSGLLWADAEVRHRIAAGALVGLVGPALVATVKRRPQGGRA